MEEEIQNKGSVAGSDNQVVVVNVVGTISVGPHVNREVGLK